MTATDLAATAVTETVVATATAAAIARDKAATKAAAAAENPGGIEDEAATAEAVEAAVVAS